MPLFYIYPQMLTDSSEEATGMDTWESDRGPFRKVLHFRFPFLLGIYRGVSSIAIAASTIDSMDLALLFLSKRSSTAVTRWSLSIFFPDLVFMTFAIVVQIWFQFAGIPLLSRLSLTWTYTRAASLGS